MLTEVSRLSPASGKAHGVSGLLAKPEFFVQTCYSNSENKRYYHQSEHSAPSGASLPSILAIFSKIAIAYSNPV
jgi:hypothetical protein